LSYNSVESCLRQTRSRVGFLMPFTMMEMMKGSAMEKRRRVKHEKTFEERLAEEA